MLRVNLGHALRTYLRTPGFTIVAIVTLALGIGGATSIFSVVDGILLRPLPYPESDRILRISRTTAHGEDGNFSAGDFLDVVRESSTLAPLAGFSEEAADVTGRGEAVRVSGLQTTAAFFDVFRVPAIVGRVYDASDAPGRALAVISEGFWARQFGRRTDIVGTQIRVNGTPTEIVGVVPAFFRHPVKADLWSLSPQAVPTSPIPLENGLADRDVNYFGAVGRLAPGATLGDANAQLAAVAARIAQAFPDTNRNDSFQARPLSDAMVADVRAGLLLLLGAVACVLLIACANVAGLMLARGLARRREMAVRASLGASQARLAWQMLTESLLLALAGGAAGLLVAAWSLDVLVALAPESLPRLDEVQIDWRVALVAFAATTVVGMISGLAPALVSSRPDLNADLKDGGRTGTPGRTRLRSALVVAEVAAALVLLIGAGLMLTSLSRLRTVDPGYRTTRLVAVDLPLPQARYDESAQRRVYREVLARVQANPTTGQAAMVFPIPLRGSNASATLEIEGWPEDTEDRQPHAELNSVSPDFFQVAGLRLLRGRVFGDLDGPEQPPVAIVNERLAALFGAEDPIGRRINLGEWATIVGVVSDARRRGLDLAPGPAVYLPYQQFVLPFMGIVVHTDMPPAVVASVVRGAVMEVDADLPIGEVRTIEQLIEDSTGQPRFRTSILLAFAALALLLAAVGIYGLMSFAVSQRTAEMGVRLALGASPWQIGALVVRHGVWLSALGAALGIVVALVAGRAVAGLLFETSVTDPLVFAGLTGLLLTIAALACYVPARRAMRVDPMRALRAE